MTRVLVFGNCHGQYLGAALSTLPGADVIVCGKAYPGPVHFRGAFPRVRIGQQCREWFRGGDVIVRLVTGENTPVPIENWTSDEPGDVIAYPYVEVRERFGLPPKFDVIKGFERAELDPAPVLAALDEPGAVLHYNKFSGSVFAALLSGVAPRLAPHFPDGAVDKLLGEMRQDLGISHDIHPSLVYAGAPGEAGERAKWVALLDAYRQTGSRSALVECFRMYRPRLHVPWTIELATALIHRGRLPLAVRFLCARIALEDARGRLFGHALGWAVPIRENYDAYKIVERAAARHPTTTLPTMLDCLRQIS
jgi:hypothetical protein